MSAMMDNSRKHWQGRGLDLNEQFSFMREARDVGRVLSAHQTSRLRFLRLLEPLLLDPRVSRKLVVWDLFTTLALLFTAFVTPFEVGFLPMSSWDEPMFLVNRAVDGIFVVDMVLQFFTVYRVQCACMALEPGAFADTQVPIVHLPLSAKALGSSSEQMSTKMARSPSGSRTCRSSGTGTCARGSPST